MKLNLWPRSLQGQMLLAVALALLVAQVFSAILLYRSQEDRREAALLHGAAFRLISATRGERPIQRDPDDRLVQAIDRGLRGFRLEWRDASPLRASDSRDGHAEEALHEILEDQGFTSDRLLVFRRKVENDAPSREHLARRWMLAGRPPGPQSRNVLIAAVHSPAAGKWLVVRVLEPVNERALVLSLIGQTLLIYGLLVGTIALILRRITRPLAALRKRMEGFTHSQVREGRQEPEGPDDVRRLIEAHGAMEERILALLDEKDVMLGAIGHDLKTPLAALRVRIESVEDDTERARMAGTIEEIVRTLDDILSLARVGRPRDPLERSELSALVASIVEEYEDLGEPVELGETARISFPLRATWLRRALRNLIGNAIRYGGVARVSLAREDGLAVIRVEDDGPGIPDGDIARMLEPFARGEPSRNTETGGAGLGLTLARAIAEQHGGTLRLVNRRDASGGIAGLTAVLSLPLT